MNIKVEEKKLNIKINQETKKIEVSIIDNSDKIDLNLTNYDDREVRDLIQENTEQIEELNNNKADRTEIKTKTSELINDSNFVSDSNYVHTDNNYTTVEKEKLSNLENYDDTEVRQLIDGKQPRGNYLTEEIDPTVPDYVKSITQQNITNWNNKADMSDIPDVSNFITKDVNNLTYYTLKTNTGSLIDLEINQTTYVVTLSLKDQDGNVISSDTLDLPLENVVVSGSYDETNQKIVLTLQSGDTVDIPVGALISGLQNEITSSNKLASDLVDDTNSGHKFVTTSEKSIWNGKQDTLIAGTNINIASDGKTISATDTTYSDATTSTSGLMSSTDKTKLDGIQTGATKNLDYYGTCSTAAKTRQKDVVCSNFVLEEGAHIRVLFTNGQTYSGAPYLNVNGTGNKTVQYKAGSSAVRYIWASGAVIDFTYNGTYWIMHRSDFATTSYYGLAKYSDSITSTSVALGATPSTINTAMINIISGTPVYSASSTYAVGDMVRYSNNVWKCTTAIEEAEAWDETHWETVAPLQTQINSKQDTLVSGTNIKTINNQSLVGSGNVGVGTITEITMNGSSKGTSGVVDLGTVITSHQDISGKQDITDNTLTTTNKTIPAAINEVNSIAKGANQAVGYNSYSDMVTAINTMDDEEFSMGQNIYIVTVEVPDLWVSSVESTSSTYTYVDDATIINELNTNGYIQVGYYKLSMLETQKVDLTNYVTNTDYASSTTGGVVRVYNSDGFAMNNGVLIGAVKTNQQYEAGGNWMMVCKGTLENVITGKGLGTYSKPSGGIPSTDLDSTVQTSLGKADGSVQLNGGSAVQTISLTSGTGTTALGLKSMASTSSYISFSNTGGWLGSYGVSSDKKPVFYNGTGYTLAYITDIPKMVTLSQADYDDLVDGGTVDSNTYYFIEEQ